MVRESTEAIGGRGHVSRDFRPLERKSGILGSLCG